MTTIDLITDQIHTMSESDIAPIAEQALGGLAIDGAINWSAQHLDITSIGNGTLGLWRITGHLHSKAGHREWSAILKIMDARIPSRTTSAQGAENEIAALESGDLSLIKTGLRPVPIFSFYARGAGSYALWMQDLSNGIQPPWDGEQFVESARHVGQFNGLWTEYDRPTGHWITTDMSTDRRAGVIKGMATDIESLASRRDHPSVQLLTEGVGMDRMLRIVSDGRRLIDATHNLPRGVAHNDCHSRNLFPRDEEGERFTYAIDWASTGLGPIGIDGGSLAGAAITWGQSEANTLAEYESEIFIAYVAGLRDSGWHGSESDVRLAYLSQVVTYVFFFPFITLVTMTPEHRSTEFFRQRLGVDDPTAVDQVSRRLTAFIHLVDEGLELVR